MELRSAAFGHGDRIPVEYTLDGENVAPPLEWTGAPEGVQSYAVIMEDPDAPTGTFRHWGIYDVASGRDRLPEATTGGAKTERLGYAYNDFGNARYDGPKPPVGHGVHHYHFKVLALDVPHLTLPDRPTVDQLRQEAESHAIAQAEIVGTYER